MPKNPEISVIIPVYNVESFLRECLDSLIAQTFTDFEIILVNDGSTDGSLKICEEYQKRHSGQVHVFSQQNKGQAVARNFALAQARGTYISFVDSDDWVSADFLEKFLEKAKEENADLIVTGYQIHCPDKTILKISGLDRIAETVRRQALLASAYSWNKFFHRDIFSGENGKYFEGIYYEDLATIPLWVMKAKKVAYLDAYPYHYRAGRVGATTTFTDERFLQSHTALLYLLQKIPEAYFSELEWIAIQGSIERYFWMAREAKARLFQKEICSFLGKNFPLWKNNQYLKKKKRLIFISRKFIMMHDFYFLVSALEFFVKIKSKLLRIFAKHAE
jgi:glycosyltransferase involved in cell wall biosynthesis